MQLRVARQSARLTDVVAFYRDGLGLPEVARFEGHASYDGVMLAIPATGAHLEFTATGHVAPPAPHIEDLLVLYLGIATASNDYWYGPVPSANPYWDEVGVSVCDPDGFRIVLVAGTWLT